jgi:hypothetical protein
VPYGGVGSSVAVSVTVPGLGVSSVVVAAPLDDGAGPAGGRSVSLVCGLGVVYVVVVVDEVVYVLDGVLLVGIGGRAGGSEESSDVLMTAKISTPSSRTAAAPAVKIVAGRLTQWSGSWSAGTPEC